MRSPIFAVIALTASLLGACTSGKATEAECQQFSDHFVALMSRGSNSAEADRTAQLAREMGKELRDKCLAEGTSAEVRCALAADSMEALQRCGDDVK